jgi:hypothetical protein
LLDRDRFFNVLKGVVPEKRVLCSSGIRHETRGLDLDSILKIQIP